MSLKIVSSIDEVETFLKELKEMIMNPYFDATRDLDILLKKKSEAVTDPHTTENTLCVSFHFARFPFPVKLPYA